MNTTKPLHQLLLSLFVIGCWLSVAKSYQPVLADSPESPDVEVAKYNLRARGISSSDCGLYTVTAAAHILGADISLKDTFGNLRVQLKPEGMSSRDIVELLHASGLAAIHVDGLSSADLQFATTPLIIPLQMQTGSNTQHWVTVCGMKDGKVALYDSVDLVSFRSKSEIDLLWNGAGLLVAASETDASRANLQLQLGAVGRKAIFVSLGCCIALLVTRMFNKHRLGRLGFLAGSTCGLVALIGWTMWHDRISSVMALQKCWQTSASARDPANEFIREIDSSPNTILVDCRMEAAYAFGHIPGARSLPINASLVSWLNFAREATPDTRVVVYCQSADCGWAEVCHQRLKCLGIRSAVLSGGYNRFVSGGE